MQIGKMRLFVHADKAKPRGGGPGVSFMLLLSVVTVQPFANIVGGYTCCDGDQNCDYVLHADTSFLLERVDSCHIITL